jgi:site-specific DNA-adenine methylase
MALYIPRSSAYQLQDTFSQVGAYIDEYIAEPISSIYTVIKNTFEEQVTTLSAISYPIEETFDYFYKKGIKVESRSKVRDYFYRYPDMMRLSKYAANIAIQRFGPDSKLYLDVYQDQETQYERLTLYVRQKKYDNKVMKIIKQIRKEYKESFVESGGRFLLTTDFRISD